MQHIKAVGAMLIVIIAMSACIIGGVPFRQVNMPDGSIQLVQHDADCHFEASAPEGVAGLTDALQSDDCFAMICAIERYADTQFCGMLDGVDPLDLEVGFTMGSLAAMSEQMSQSFANSASG